MGVTQARSCFTKQGKQENIAQPKTKYEACATARFLKEKRSISKITPKARWGTSLLGKELVSGCWVCQVGTGHLRDWPFPVCVYKTTASGFSCPRDVTQEILHGRLMYVRSHCPTGWKEDLGRALFCRACSQRRA